MTGFPTLTVEIAFATVPSSLTPTWTNVTAYLAPNESITYGHGRPDRFGTSQAGTCSLVLDNTDGRFTAGNTSGAYYPNVKVGKRLRISYVWNAVTYRKFDGYINEWPVVWPTGMTNYAEARITATDRFGKFGRARRLRSILQEEVLYDAPTAYWPLGEPAGSQSASDVSGPQTNLAVTKQGTLTGTPISFGAGIGPPTDGLPALMLAPNDTDNGYYLRASNITGAVVGGVSTMECWFVCTVADPLSAETLMASVFGDNISHARLLIVAAGGLRLVANSFDASGVATAQIGTAVSVVNNGLHHAVAVTTMSATAVTATLYVDGALVGTQTTATSGKTTPTIINNVGVGAMPPRSGTPALGMFTGTLAHAAVYGKALTPAQAFNHYTAGKTGFAGERSDARIARYARYTGVIDATQLALDVGASGISAQTVDAGDVLSLMQEVVDAEDGQLFMSGDGKLTFQARTRRYSLASAFTLHGTTTNDIEPADTTFVSDTQFVVNDATYTRPNGPTQRAVNATSIADYDTYTDERTLALLTDNEVLDRANWRVNVTGTPAPRCSTVRIDLAMQTSTSLITSVVAAEVSTRFTTDQLPAQAPASSVDLVVEGITETLGPSEWSVVFNTSPALALTNIWQFDAVDTFNMTFGY